MAIVRCDQCGKPRKTKIGTYVRQCLPVGHPENGVICGRSNCKNPGKVWFKEHEDTLYESGERVFEIHTQTAKVKVQ